MALVGMASKPLHVRRLQKALQEWVTNPGIYTGVQSMQIMTALKVALGDCKHVLHHSQLAIFDFNFRFYGSQNRLLIYFLKRLPHCQITTDKARYMPS